MNFTGERPTIDEGVESSRQRYKCIIPYCLDKNVFDFGCGVGQGSFFLSKFAKLVKGYECCIDALNEAKLMFICKNLSFVDNYSDLSKIDIISMIEVIEHIELNQVPDLLQLLSKNVQSIVLTTPNGDLYQYHPKDKSERRGFHVWHYTESELNELFSKYYKFVNVLGCIRSTEMGIHMGYLVYATNLIEWKDSWLKCSK